VVGDHDAEDGVAEELQALVGVVAGMLGAPGTVDQRGRQEVGGQVEPEALDELRKVWDRKRDERS
jgi:hypothetical protein